MQSRCARAPRVANKAMKHTAFGATLCPLSPTRCSSGVATSRWRSSQNSSRSSASIPCTSTTRTRVRVSIRDPGPIAQSHLTCGSSVNSYTTYDTFGERVAMAITAAVGGCEQGDPADPGNLQFDWLAVQLARFRSRGMQVRVRWSRRSKLSRFDSVGVLGVETLFVFAGLVDRPRTPICGQFLP